MDYVTKLNVYTIENGANRKCFDLEILEDNDKECNEHFLFKVELKLGLDTRRIKFPDNKPYTYGKVVINETCTFAQIFICKCELNLLLNRYGMLHMVTPTSLLTDASISLQKMENFVNEEEGFIEICAVMTTPCNVCPQPKGNITLSITPESATSNS